MVPVGDFVFGDSITFECEVGYTLSGTATASCGADGTLGVVDAVCTAGLFTNTQPDLKHTVSPITHNDSRCKVLL